MGSLHSPIGEATEASELTEGVVAKRFKWETIEKSDKNGKNFLCIM